MNSLKLLECIGNIDEAYIAELERTVNAASAASAASDASAASAPVRKSRYKNAKYVPWLCAAAACLLFAFIGTHFLPAEEGIEKNEITVTETTSPLTPSESDISQLPGVNGVPVTPGTPDVSDTAVTASPLTSAVPDTLEHPAAIGVPVTPETPATSVIPVTTEASATPPEPYHIPEGGGGDEMSAFNDPVQFILLGIDGKLCGDRDVDGWFKAKREANPIPDDLSSHANLYSFIHDFGIPREEAEAAMEYYINSDDPQLRFSTEIFDLIYSENTAELGRLYANAHTIAKGEKLYTPKWLYYHTPEEWTAAGITPDDVESRLHQYENIPFSPEGREYFGELISEFLGRRVSLADPYADWENEPVPVVEAVPEDTPEDVFDETLEEIEETDIYP